MYRSLVGDGEMVMDEGSDTSDLVSLSSSDSEEPLEGSINQGY